MPRRQFQLGPSYFEVREGRQNYLGDWWVLETFRVLDRHNEKDDRDEWHGPYADRARAVRAMAQLQEGGT